MKYPSRVMRGSLLGLFGVAALLVTTEACSLLVDTSADQCTTDADCTSKGGAFAGSVCSADHTCQIRCTSNKACSAQLGVQAVCVQQSGACSALLSEDCKTIFQQTPADLDAPGAVLLGMLFPMTGENAASERSRVNAVELARRHINNSSSGLPGVNGGPARPLVFLACDDAINSVRAARHLANDLRVPAIIGPAFSGVTTTVASQVTIPAGTLIISPSATSPTLTDLGDKGLVWRTAPSDVIQSDAMVKVVSSKLEPEVRTAYGLKDTDNIRIAVAHKGDAYGAGLASALSKGLRWNLGGQDTTQNADFYKQLDYGNPQTATPAELAASYKKTVDAIVQFKPHILITIGTTEAVTEIFGKVESSWPSTETMRPRHLVSDGLQVPEMLTQVGTNEPLRKRVLGTIPGVPGVNYASFKIAFDGVFPDTPADSYSAGAYDATLLVAFSIAAAGNKPLTGALINEGLKKTVPGPKAVAIEADPNQIPKGFAAMAADGIDYNGASGPLDFNPDTGEAPADIQIWCLKAQSGKPFAFSPSGVIFGAKSNSLEGSFTCP